MAGEDTSRFRKKRKNYSQISNIAINDPNLSLRAKGLYALIEYFLAIPDFVLYKKTLAKACTEGETAFKNTWKELKDAGYLVQYKIQTQKGFIYEYELLDEPSKEDFPTGSFSTPGEPTPGNPTGGESPSIINTISNNTISNNTKENNVVVKAKEKGLKTTFTLDNEQYDIEKDEYYLEAVKEILDKYKITDSEKLIINAIMMELVRSVNVYHKIPEEYFKAINELESIVNSLDYAQQKRFFALPEEKISEIIYVAMSVRGTDSEASYYHKKNNIESPKSYIYGTVINSIKIKG